jgi:serine protease Do
VRRWQTWFWWRGSQLVFWVVVALVLWGLVGPRLTGPQWWWPFLQRPGPAVVVAQPGTAAPGGWTAVAKAAMPAVVNISSSKTVRGAEQGPPAPFFSDPFFRFFFGPEPAPRRERSLGSGVIVTADGYVLTNNHVVEGAQDIRVTLADRREFKAKLVGTDPKTDLAVLRLPGSGFPVVPLGDSGRVEVAEVVLAIGNPFGLGQTVTMGIVSAVGRANVGIADYEDFIQTDAAINPGNSGGALVNARGELIGINTAIFTQSGGSMGIGFAVPVNMTRQVMDHLVRRGRVTRGYLGVGVQEITPAIARGLGLPEGRGILVGDVGPDGPAARAGIRRGDVIAAVDGRPVEDTGHFRNLVAGTAPGTRLRLTLLRQGREQVVEVTVAELPERAPAAAAAARARPDPLGLSVTELTPEVARRLGLPPGLQGTVVAEVLPGGLAAEAGLRPGDVIQEVNRRPVRSPQEFARAVQQAGDRDLVLLVNRGGSTAYLVLERAG